MWADDGVDPKPTSVAVLGAVVDCDTAAALGTQRFVASACDRDRGVFERVGDQMRVAIEIGRAA
jgi:hypothetical protein